MDWKKTLHVVAFALLVIGGINWGLIGFLGPKYDLLMLVFANMAPVRMLIETLVGVSAIYLLITHKGECKVCGGK